MFTGMRIRLLPISCAVALLTGVPSLGHAQGMFKDTPKQAPKPELPPGLPGATPSRGVAPPTHGPSDMEPTDALFDAINRGDIGSARDAISRGADLHGRNVLGLTPLELSVDLGRNDISFLLLSMRGGDDGQSRQPPAVATAKKSPGAKQARQVPQRAPARVAAPTPQQTAHLFSGDGGTPNPGAGFLGFGSGQR